jgi:RNA polymerase sigma-70 factor, ECF subfamily
VSAPRLPGSAPVVRAGDDADAQLLAGARHAAPDAIANLYRRYAGPLLRMLRVMTGSQEDAEDIVHDLFLGLPESLRAYEHRGQLYPWLRAVAVRIALMKMRVSRRREHFAGDEAEGRRVAAPATDPWSATDLEAAIARLPESLRVVFVLRQIEDRSHDETAALLGISAGAVRVRYVRAIRQLRAFLEHES